MIEKELEYHLLTTAAPVIKDDSAYYLLSHAALNEDPRKLIFLEWLRKEMLESQRQFI